MDWIGQINYLGFHDNMKSYGFSQMRIQVITCVLYVDLLAL